jgi:hypothetical protein
MEREYRWSLLTAPLLAFAAYALARASASEEPVLWAIDGAVLGLSLACVITDERARRKGRPLPVCRCRAGSAPTLTRMQRRPRLLAGALLSALALLLIPFSMAASVLAAWFGVSHLVSWRTGYPGCPELGALPALALGRPVMSGCGPWCGFDERRRTPDCRPDR